MTNLQALTLYIIDGEPEMSNFPHLTYLNVCHISRLDSMPSSLQSLQFETASTGIRTAKQFLNLTYLKCPPKYSRYAQYIMPNLKRYESPVEDYEGVFSCSLTALERLKANIPIKDLNPLCLTKLKINAPIGWSHFSPLTNLKRLKWENSLISNLTLDNFLFLERLFFKSKTFNESMIKSMVYRLTRLDIALENSFLHQIDAVSKLTGLRVLRIATDASLDCSVIKTLTNLTRLTITAPSAVNLTLVNDLVKLADLNVKVDRQRTADGNSFMGLSKLTSLSLDGLNIMVFHPDRFNPLDLQHLTLKAGDSAPEDPVFINLTTFTNLTYLSTNLCCSWNEIVKLTKLLVLRLTRSCDDCDTANMTALARLTMLEYTGNWTKGRKCPFTRLQVLQMPSKESDFTTGLRFYTSYYD